MNIVRKHQMGLAAVIFDGDSPQIIVQKMESARYLIDMRTDISDPLEDIVARYYAEQNGESKKKEPKYKFVI